MNKEPIPILGIHFTMRSNQAAGRANHFASNPVLHRAMALSQQDLYKLTDPVPY